MTDTKTPHYDGMKVLNEVITSVMTSFARTSDGYLIMETSLLAPEKGFYIVLFQTPIPRGKRSAQINMSTLERSEIELGFVTHQDNRVGVYPVPRTFNYQPDQAEKMGQDIVQYLKAEKLPFEGRPIVKPNLSLVD